MERSTSRVERMRQARNRMAEMRKRECLRSAKDMNVMISSKDVDANLVQDRSKKMVIIGSDVVGLYPCMVGSSVGEECYQAVLETEIEFEGVDYKEGVRYLALNWTKKKM